MISSLVHRLASVVLLITVCPFWALAQSADVLAESKRGFTYSAEWDRRIQTVTHERGGGAIDGGGGNVTASGQLLDQYVQSDLTKLEAAKLRELVEAEFGYRLQFLEQAMPGFNGWLMAALKLPWNLDPKPLNPELCRNASLHAGKNKIAACQDMRRVHLSEAWYKSAIIKRPKTVAALLVHEFIRFHVIRLARVKAISRAEQDGITEEVTAKILSDSSASEIKPLLVSTGLLLRDYDVDMRRMKTKLEVINMMGATIRTLRQFIAECSTMAREHRQQHYDFLIGFLEIHEKEIKLYKELSTANDPANDSFSDERKFPDYIQRMQASCRQ